MKRTAFLLSSTLVLAACQSTPIHQVTQQALAPVLLQQNFSSAAEPMNTPVVIQKSPVLGPEAPRPEGQIRISGSTVNVEIVLPPLSGFQTQALDLPGDNATKIVATVSDSHGKNYTPVGADGDGKVNYPVSGNLSLSFNDVVPDSLLVIELQIEDNAAANIPQAHLAAVVSHTAASDVNTTINFQTTPTALAMKALIGADADRARAINLGALVSKMDEITGVTGTAPNLSYTTHPSLVNTAQLALDLAAQQPSSLTAAAYRLVGATIDLTVNGLVGTDKIQVDVTDAASARASNVGASGSITGATPGTGLKVNVGAESSNSTQYTFAVNPGTVDLNNNATRHVTVTATPVAVTIATLTPSFGAIGSSVTIAGTGFSTVASNNTVFFGTEEASVTSVNVTGTSMVVSVPAGVSGTQAVTVQVGSQTSNSSDYEVKPVISSLSASNGVVGDSITINGTGFRPTAGQNTVRFGTTTATVTQATSTALTVTIPNDIAASQPVTVQVGNQTSDSSAFNITPVLNLPVSAASPDTVVTFMGSGFSPILEQNTIRFGSTDVTPVSVNAAGTSMSVAVPNVFGSMNVRVSVAGQNSAFRNFRSIPVITNLSSFFGSTGDSITITGKGFDSSTPANNIVKLGAVDATVTAATATTVTITVPEMPANTANATVQVGTLTSADASFSVFNTISSLSTAEAVAGKAVLIRGQILTIAGTNFDPIKANNSVIFGLSNSSQVTVNGADLVSATATEIQVRVPAGVDVPGDVDVTVDTHGITNTAPDQAIVPEVTLNIHNGGFY